MSTRSPSSLETSLESGESTQHTLFNDVRPSWQSRCIVRVLRCLPMKKRLASAAVVHERVRKLALRPASYGPTGLGRGVDITLKRMEGWPVYETVSTASPQLSNQVVFLHGGGYINEIVRAHWRFIGYVTRAARVRCIVPIYPLAPHATAKEVVPTMGNLLRRVIANAEHSKVIVIGNSAGAGLALSAAQWLREFGYRQPNGLVLISPGLDASVSREQQRAIAANDPLLALPGIIAAAQLYAGELDLTHPYVSPLRGDFCGLPSMLVFAGTLDTFYPDSIDLVAKARAARVPVELHLQPGQPHNYPILPTPEGRRAREIILRAVATGMADPFEPLGKHEEIAQLVPIP